MDDSIKTYKCPNCGAALTFDSKTQKLHCSHCDTSIDVEAMKADLKLSIDDFYLNNNHNALADIIKMSVTLMQKYGVMVK